MCTNLRHARDRVFVPTKKGILHAALGMLDEIMVPDRSGSSGRLAELARRLVREAALTRRAFAALADRLQHATLDDPRGEPEHDAEGCTLDATPHVHRAAPDESARLSVTSAIAARARPHATVSDAHIGSSDPA